MEWHGNIEKLHTTLAEPVEYQLPIGDQRVPMNGLIGRQISLRYHGEIHCIGCGRKTRKSFNQGFCYPCLQSLPQCDSCIIKPEQCHYAAGTCRDAGWGEVNCLTDHFVYLANSSGLKVGITRGSQVPTRWMDQGAVQALPIFRVRDRLTSGLVEVAMKGDVNDKTSWQRMLKGEPEPIDLAAQRDRLYTQLSEPLNAIVARQGEGSVVWLEREEAVQIHYPVSRYPEKVNSFNLDKTAEVSGVLMGIKGQYLILDSGVLNIRKFAGYRLTLQLH